ncbi:hypothetical protein GN958_ATG05592 [Phytophthora infestans]|uniref:Uncharacterized protein n=1 Tax=Phytophthora infestans TaxID=4787 RepID=A0A8S9TTS8_PHYIN|nr:hypothetical protein GN958_ATG18679 [Phytophthora infestans]KAF4145238.1 hypothetical protein GN958_ATG05592 [Phytophthora infestans]
MGGYASKQIDAVREPGFYGVAVLKCWGKLVKSETGTDKKLELPLAPGSFKKVSTAHLGASQKTIR